MNFCSMQSVNATENRYACTVKNFVSTSNDPEFKLKNLRKKFLVTVGKETIFVTQITSDYKNSQKLYKIIKRGTLGIFSMKGSNIGFDTFIFVEEKGEGTFSFQTFVGVNSWHIKCKST